MNRCKGQALLQQWPTPAMPFPAMPGYEHSKHGSQLPGLLDGLSCRTQIENHLQDYKHK